MSDDPASLERLHDLAPPAPVPWWPLAPGWYVVAALILIVAGLGAWRWWHRWRRQAYRRAALAELCAWETGRDRGAPLAAKDVQHLAALLRRTALAFLPREQVAGLSESAWIGVLNEALPESPLQSWEWLSSVYQVSGSLSEDQSRAAVSELRDWLEHHQFSNTPPPC